MEELFQKKMRNFEIKTEVDEIKKSGKKLNRKT